MTDKTSSGFVTQGQFIDFIEKTFGEGYLSRDKQNLSVVCPKCKKLKNTEKKKLAIHTTFYGYHCWSCKIKGKNIGSLIKRYKPFAFPFFHEKFGSSVKSIEQINESDEIDGINLKLPLGFISFVDAINIKHESLKKFLPYIKQRGLTYNDLVYYKLGFTDLDKDFKDKIIIPSFDEQGKLNFFTSRMIHDRMPQYKYLNCNEDVDSIIYNELYINWEEPLLVVEGPFDAIKCQSQNVLCLLGKRINKESYLFHTITTKKPKIILCLDSDAINEQEKIAKTLFENNIDVSVLELPEGMKDFGDLKETNDFEQILSSCYPWFPSNYLAHKVDSLSNFIRKDENSSHSRHSHSFKRTA